MQVGDRSHVGMFTGRLHRERTDNSSNLVMAAAIAFAVAGADIWSPFLRPRLFLIILIPIPTWHGSQVPLASAMFGFPTSTINASSFTNPSLGCKYATVSDYSSSGFVASLWNKRAGRTGTWSWVAAMTNLTSNYR